MGVDFIAYGEHHLEPGSGCDPKLFARHPGLRPAVEWTRDFLRQSNPNFQDDDVSWELEFGLRSLRLAGTFRILLGCHLFLVTHIARWHTFLTDPGARGVLQQAARAIADVLGSSAVYYLPDSSFAPSIAIDHLWAGGSLEDFHADLIHRCGMPSLDLGVIYREDIDDAMLERGYFYEALPTQASPSIS
jgi:hypothetical protein